MQNSISKLQQDQEDKEITIQNIMAEKREYVKKFDQLEI